MKTLLFTLEYPPFYGGVANYYGNLIKFWPKADNIFVLDNNDGRLVNNKLPFLKWLPAFFALRQKIKQENIKHVLVGQILPLGTVALVCSWFGKTEYSVVLHGMDFSNAAKLGRKKMITKKILIGADKIICSNSYTAELVKSFLGSRAGDRIKTVNPGVEKNRELGIRNYEFLKNKYNLHNKIILLSVGRLVKRKGFDRVIEAMPKVLEKTPNLYYVIIGNGEEWKNLKIQISNLKLDNNVLIINNTEDEERDIWYNLCDIFIMPSRNINGDFEGFGIVYLEANLAGKPVIASRSGGIEDAVKDGLNGLLVDEENAGEIGLAILKLAGDADLRRKLGEQGRRRAINDFNWEKQAEKIYKLIV